ncbi:MAG: 4-hydroxy-3-methylbut-2-enyl diphosphate reductase [Rhodothermales bacterium]
MARQFNVPVFYRSPIISKVKEARRIQDPLKRDLSPSVLDFGPIRFKIARHFGFCYGVENAIEIAYRAIEENPDRRLFLLSEMIHNPHVNEDLKRRGMRFLRTTSGEQLISFDALTPDDIVLIPAFGTTLEIQADLERRGIDTRTYNTTCPFVEKVWRRSHQIGTKHYTIVVHGKRYHEETRATFSHAKEAAPVVVVRDLDEARDLARVIGGEVSVAYFFERFQDRYSDGFDPERDLRHIGVVNQTTMLASETQAIAELLRRAVSKRYGEAHVSDHFADTSDTLCYATHENQEATRALIEASANLALIVGGYNSSNTSHLVELCRERMPSYFIKDAGEILSLRRIRHFDYLTATVLESNDWFPEQQPADIVLTAGASCPDALLDQVVHIITTWFPEARPVEEVLAPFETLAVE